MKTPAEVPNRQLVPFRDKLHRRAFYDITGTHFVRASPEESAFRVASVPGATQLAFHIEAQTLLNETNLDNASWQQIFRQLDIAATTRCQLKDRLAAIVNADLALWHAKQEIDENGNPRVARLADWVIADHVSSRATSIDNQDNRHLGRRLFTAPRHQEIREKLKAFRPAKPGKTSNGAIVTANASSFCATVATYREELLRQLESAEKEGLLPDRFRPSRLRHISHRGLAVATRKIETDRANQIGTPGPQPIRAARNGAREDLGFLAQHDRDNTNPFVSATHLLANFFGFYTTEQN